MSETCAVPRGRFGCPQRVSRSSRLALVVMATMVYFMLRWNVVVAEEEGHSFSIDASGATTTMTREQQDNRSGALPVSLGEAEEYPHVTHKPFKEAKVVTTMNYQDFLRSAEERSRATHKRKKNTKTRVLLTFFDPLDPDFDALHAALEELAVEIRERVPEVSFGVVNLGLDDYLGLHLAPGWEQMQSLCMKEMGFDDTGSLWDDISINFDLRTYVSAYSVLYFDPANDNENRVLYPGVLDPVGASKWVKSNVAFTGKKEEADRKKQKGRKRNRKNKKKKGRRGQDSADAVEKTPSNRMLNLSPHNPAWADSVPIVELSAETRSLIRASSACLTIAIVPDPSGGEEAATEARKLVELARKRFVDRTFEDDRFPSLDPRFMISFSKYQYVWAKKRCVATKL